MIIIRKINNNETLPFKETEATQAFAVDIKTQQTTADDVQLCFLIEDKTTSTPIGFYGLSYGYDYGDDWFNACFTIDYLHIVDQNPKFDWADALYEHLTEQVTDALISVKNRITDHQVLTVDAIVPEAPELEDLLAFVVRSVCESLNLHCS